MKHYVYQVKTVSEYIRSQKCEEELQSLLDEKASEGWRLVSTQYLHLSGKYVIVFEKESEL